MIGTELSVYLYACDRGHAHCVVEDGGETTDSVLPEDLPDWVKEICRDDHGRFAPCGASNSPSPGNPRRTGRSDREWQAERARRFQSAHSAVKRAREAGQPTPIEHVREMMKHLAGLTVKQLHQIKKDHGLKASAGTKEQLKNKVADLLLRADSKARGRGDAVPDTKAKVPEGTLGETKNIKWSDPGQEKAADQAAADILGPGKTAIHLISSAGVLDGSTVSVYRGSGYRGEKTAIVEFRGKVKDKAGNENRYNGTRTFTRESNGKVHVHNDLFEGKGGGLKMIGRQVENAAKHGVDRIETFAAGSGAALARDPRSMNGFYTWPRFGYNDRVPSGKYDALPDAVRRDVDAAGGMISGVMKTEEGRDWWKANGSGLQNCVFDLKAGSYSQRTLTAYMREKGLLT